jgi:hypothetical protein
VPSPTVVLDGNIYQDNGRKVFVLIRATITNDAPQPVFIAWSRIGSYAEVVLEGGRKLLPSRGSRDRPAGIGECRWRAEVCWDRYREAFTEVPAGGTVSGTITFVADIQPQEVDSALDNKNYDFNAPLMFGYPDSATAKTLSVSLTKQPLKKRT